MHKRTRMVLRGQGRSNPPALPDNPQNVIYTNEMLLIG